MGHIISGIFCLFMAWFLFRAALSNAAQEYSWKKPFFAGVICAVVGIYLMYRAAVILL